MSNYGHGSDFKASEIGELSDKADRIFLIDINLVAFLKLKNFEMVNINTNYSVLLKFQYHHIVTVSFLIAFQFENRIFIKLCFFEFCNKFVFFDIVSAMTPKLLNIIPWCKGRTFLCVNTLPILAADYQV